MRRIKRLQQRNSSITRGRNRTEATKTAATPNRYKSALGHRKTTPTACSLLYRYIYIDLRAPGSYVGTRGVID